MKHICAKCNHSWESDNPQPARCTSQDCRTRSWRGHETGHEAVMDCGHDQMVTEDGHGLVPEPPTPKVQELAERLKGRLPKRRSVAKYLIHPTTDVPPVKPPTFLECGEVQGYCPTHRPKWCPLTCEQRLWYTGGKPRVVSFLPSKASGQDLGK